MPVIYYTEYEPSDLNVREISRLEHELGLSLLSKGISELYGISICPDDIEKNIDTHEFGKPYIVEHPEIFFNITHCRGLAACAFSESPIGIDAELAGYFPEVLINRILTDSEKSILISRSAAEPLRQEWFYRFWTLKEAYVKKTGIGVDTDLKAFSFSFDHAFDRDSDQADDLSGFMTVICSDDEVSCFQKMLESGHIISLCTDNSPRNIVGGISMIRR